jgi:hypothetical protein
LINGELVPVDQSIARQKDDKTEIHEYNLTFDQITRIDLCFLNKQDCDTKIDQAGKIIEDMLIVIDKIQIDHVDLTNKLTKISVYKDSNGLTHKTFNYITFNGIYTIKLHKNLLYTEWLSGHI